MTFSFVVGVATIVGALVGIVSLVITISNTKRK